jgi:hypothetical protein
MSQVLFINSMRRIGIPIAAMLIFFSCSCQPSGKKTSSEPLLKELWATDSILKTPESVLYDRQRKVIYVANVNGVPSARDGNGFISKLSPDGQVIQLKWIEGLDAPKGMAIWNNRLYVSDIKYVVEIDLDKGEIMNRYEATDAQFLNDVSCDINGHVYISDSGDEKIYLLYQGRLEIWAQSHELKGANGLWVENDYLLVGCENRINRIHHETRAIEPFIENTGSIDGLVPDGRGNYLVSDWTGHISLVGVKAARQLLMDTTPQKINAADIDFLVDERMLLVPTFYDNRVIAYQVK